MKTQIPQTILLLISATFAVGFSYAETAQEAAVRKLFEEFEFS